MNFFGLYFPRPSIADIFMTAFILALFWILIYINGKSKQGLMNAINELENYKNSSSIKSAFLKNIFSEIERRIEYFESFGEMETTIDEIIDTELKSILPYEKFLERSGVLVIIAGLTSMFIGVFFSLGQAAGYLLKSSNSSIPPSIMQWVIEGLSYSFFNAVIGFICAFIFNIFYSVKSFDTLKAKLKTNVKQIILRKNLNRFSHKKNSSFDEFLDDLGNKLVDFSDKISNSIYYAVDQVSSNFKNVIVDVSLTSRDLSETVSNFKDSTDSLANSLSTMTNFNNNLKSELIELESIYRNMYATFKDLSEKMIYMVNNSTKNFEKYGDFVKTMKETVDELSKYNNNNIEYMKKYSEELKTYFESVEGMGNVLKQDFEQRLEEFNKYRQNYIQLVDGISQNIASIGESTSKLLQDSLKEGSKAIAENVKNSSCEILEELQKVLEQFKENEQLFAKTIATLPDRAITYSEATANKLEKQIDEIKNYIIK